MIDQIKKMVDVSKQVLDTLPRNNVKNKQKYQSVLEEQVLTFENYKSELEKEILKRIKKYTNFTPYTELDKTKEQIENIKGNLFLLNDYNSSYEKFNFDRLLYKLNRFYKEDLEDVNSNILECVNIFEKVGVNLKSDDFNYSEFANKYMKVLLEDKIDEQKIKEAFENIYWQCPDLLIHIELNFKSLYYKYQKEFAKYLETLKKQFIKSYEGKNIIIEYNDLLKQYDIDRKSSLDLMLNKFLNKELNISDYQQIKIEKYYKYFTEDNITNNEEINKMSDSVKEYQGYLTFKYIIDDIKKLYSLKNSYKESFKNKFKQIQKQEKLLFKYNKKNNKKSKGKINIKINNLIKEIENLYKELDNIIFCDRLYENLTDESSIYEALCLAASHYSYIIKCMKQYGLEGDFYKEQKSLINYILNPYNNLIQNISIIETKDIPLIICDRYKLSGFHINKESLEDESGINEIIDNSNKIDIYINFVSKIGYENLRFILEAKDIFNK